MEYKIFDRETILGLPLFLKYPDAKLCQAVLAVISVTLIIFANCTLLCTFLKMMWRNALIISLITHFLFHFASFCICIAYIAQ